MKKYVLWICINVVLMCNENIGWINAVGIVSMLVCVMCITGYKTIKK